MRWSDFIFIWGFAVRKIEGSPDCSEPIKSRIPSIWLSGHLGAKVTCRHQWPPGAARALSFVIWVVSAFYSTKIQDWNFGNFTLWMEWCYQLNLSDPSHCMFCSKSSSRDSNFVKWKGALKWPDWSKWTTFNCGRKYSGRTGHKIICSIWSPREISIILSWMENTNCNVCPTPWQLRFKFLHSLGNSRDETPRMGPWECWELSRLI